MMLVVLFELGVDWNYCLLISGCCLEEGLPSSIGAGFDDMLFFLFLSVVTAVLPYPPMDVTTPSLVLL